MKKKFDIADASIPYSIKRFERTKKGNKVVKDFYPSIYQKLSVLTMIQLIRTGFLLVSTLIF